MKKGNKCKRQTELENIIKESGSESEVLLKTIVEEVIFLEKRLEELKKLPFLSVNPKNQAQQRTTPAAKQYKELLQQYTNCVKVIAKAIGQDDTEADSPLRVWVKAKLGGQNAH